VLHWRLSISLTTNTSNSSHLRYILKTAPQRQATVKFHGVFASHWESLAFAPGWNVREILVWDSGDLVIPFMQAVIQTARHFAHVCYFPLAGTNQKIGGHVFLHTSLHRCKDRTISSPVTKCLAYSLWGFFLKEVFPADYLHSWIFRGRFLVAKEISYHEIQRFSSI